MSKLDNWEQTMHKILLIDDDLDFRALIKKKLLARTDRNYLIFEMDNGANAVKMTEQEHPTVIIMDMLLPNSDGYISTAKIKANEDTKEIPIIGIFSL